MIKEGGDAPPAVILAVPVAHDEVVDNWDGGNPVALASSPYCRFTSARLAPAPSELKKAGMPLPPSGSKPQSPPKVGMPPPAVILAVPVVHDFVVDNWDGGNPVALASSPYCRFTSARLAPTPVRIKAGGDAPPAVILAVPVAHDEVVDNWDGGNPVALASSPYCRFTSARLAPAPVRIKAGGDAPSRRHSRRPSCPRRSRGQLGRGESSGSCK